MEWHLASIWETIADAVPEAPAIIHGDVRRTWAAYDERAARLASAFGEAGLGPDSKIGLYLANRNEYLEAHFAAFKIRGVPVNVNWRYLDDELVYLLDNSDAEAVVFQGAFAERIARVRGRLPRLKLLIQVDDGAAPRLDGAGDYEAAIAGHAPMARIARSADDIYMLYTGGTTGMPKGVMYRHGDISQGLMLGYDLAGMPRPTNSAELAASARAVSAAGAAPVSLVGCPLMHGTGMWVGTIVPQHLGGAAVTLTSTHFDADELWRTVVANRCTDITIVGDAFAKPMAAALDGAAAAGRPYDISGVRRIWSSGVMWTAEVKQRLLVHAPMTLIDAMGSTEGGMGMSVTTRESAAGTARFQMNPTTKVFTDDGREVKPGSGEMGKVAAGGAVPLGYFKDPVKSDATFRVIDGVRYSFPGDYATVEADGTITLLGRGSQCINTAGEKVFPEEVEEAVKQHASVWDCLVVGVPDERYGEVVAAVVSPRPGAEIAPADIVAEVRGRLAGYKQPRHVIAVDEVRRAPNGKADYKWAKAVARERLGIS
jgi:fatty-acyl-CoA synthase